MSILADAYNDTPEFLHHPKVRQARRLLLEAAAEIRAHKRALGDRMRCRCGHLHKNHLPSHSINYTAGMCSKKCNCMGFVHNPKGDPHAE